MVALPSPPHPDRARPLVYAHRGGAALRPENTIEAFDHGLRLGADGLELDVHLTRDGVVVVIHDDTLERTTDARGAVSDLTAAELAGADAGYRFTNGNPDDPWPFRARGVRIPALGDVLARYRDVPIIIELKQNVAELARRTIDLIRRADAVDRVTLGSFWGGVLRAARAYDPAVRTGASSNETRWALYRSWVGLPLGRTRYREFQVPERSGQTTVVSPRFVQHAHRAGLPVKVWTIDDPADMRRLLAWGADAIITDRPDQAMVVVGRR